jgi:AcrR family transcriptional regulator
MAPAQAAAHRRGRLMGAMVEAVRRHGYAATTIAELVALAGVSKSAFYECFDSKQECFLATFDEILEKATRQIGVAYRSGTGLEARLRAAMETCAAIIAKEPAASALVVVDSLSLGEAGVAPRERAVETFALIFRQSFAQESRRGTVSELEVRAITTGIRRVLYRCLRQGKPEKLKGELDQLVPWVLSYQRPRDACSEEGSDDDASGEAARAPTPAPQMWSDPPDSPRSRRELTQRERIVRAAALVAAERGYERLTIPAISAAAGVSNATFYQHFHGKEEAFIAAFDALSREAWAATMAASAGIRDWPESVRTAVRGLLEFTAANHLFARLAFFELPTAGAGALDRADATAKSFTVFLEPGNLPAAVPAPAPVVVEAIGGGIWGVIQHEIAHRGEASLADRAAEIADIALAPLGLA